MVQLKRKMMVQFKMMRSEDKSGDCISTSSTSLKFRGRPSLDGLRDK